jgi:pimeloyl-ACP methyl ester carboxylesterase
MSRTHASLLLATFLVAGCASVPPPKPFTSDRITVTTYGSGPDVVLIPGLEARATDVWDGVMRDVPGYRFHVVQVAGFGGFPSGANAGDGPVVEPVGAEIARYIKESRLQKPAVVGLSMGGCLTLMVAARHPSLVSKIFIVDMVPFGGVFFGKPGSINSSAAAEPIARERLKRLLAETEEERKARTTAIVTGMIRTENRRQAVIEHGLASDPTVSARAFTEIITLDLRPELSNFHGPATVLYVVSPFIPLTPEETDKLYAASYATLPQAKLKRIPDAYHFIMLDQPARFASELREFLK